MADLMRIETSEEREERRWVEGHWNLAQFGKREGHDFIIDKERMFAEGFCPSCGNPLENNGCEDCHFEAWMMGPLMIREFPAGGEGR